MAQFYADIKGDRGQVTRTGTKNSGLYGHVRGWSVGGVVDVLHIDGKDVVRVYATSGSKSGQGRKLIAEFSDIDQVTEIQL